MKWIVFAVLAASASAAEAPRTIAIPVGNLPVQIQADVYGKGSSGVVLAHGGRFGKESWRQQGEMLASAGFTAVAIRFRGDAPNPDGSASSVGTDFDNATDVLAAVAYLRKSGATAVSAVGASFGGDAVGDANVRSEAGELERVVFLGSNGGSSPAQLKGAKLFIVARDDRGSSGLRLPAIQDHYARAHEPKKLVVLDGSAHAQFLFATPQGPRLSEEILRFLSGN